MNSVQFIFSLLLVFLVVGYSEDCKILGTVPNPSPAPDTKSPESYTVSFSTNALINGQPAAPIVLQVTRSWAPLGSDRFYSLVMDGFYNQAAFFRVVPDFVVQFGISADPVETAKWNTIIPDDPVLMSNTNWTVSYATAGPDTRTSQIFINYVDNSRLDESGFAPFAKVISGFDTALALVNPTPGNSNGVNQEMYEHKGNEWILNKYPEISLITCTTVQEL
jgi:peptidyl-prolyl cis-trans isomerase A (cyclophilin A)